MKDALWLLMNGYKDVTEKLKKQGFYPPKETIWAEWSMGNRKLITFKNKFYEKI